jgi:hypothetical protein
MSITAFSRYGIADASIVPLLANATLTRQHLKAMFFHETYQHMLPYLDDYIGQRTTQMGSRWRNYYCHRRL